MRSSFLWYNTLITNAAETWPVSIYDCIADCAIRVYHTIIQQSRYVQQNPRVYRRSGSRRYHSASTLADFNGWFHAVPNLLVIYQFDGNQMIPSNSRCNLILNVQIATRPEAVAERRPRV
jgi:hypothetical protein